MKVKYHLSASIIISGILYVMFKSWGLAIASFISGVFIDLDHIIDYLRCSDISFNVNKFFNYFNNKEFDKVFLIFHGWEWLAVLTIAAKMSNWNPWVTGVLIGYGQHIILDQLGNGAGSLDYFFFWRWKNGFSPEAINVTEAEEKNIIEKRYR